MQSGCRAERLLHPTSIMIGRASIRTDQSFCFTGFSMFWTSLLGSATLQMENGLNGSKHVNHVSPVPSWRIGPRLCLDRGLSSGHFLLNILPPRGPWCSGRVGPDCPLCYKGIIWPRPSQEYSISLTIGSMIKYNPGLSESFRSAEEVYEWGHPSYMFVTIWRKPAWECSWLRKPRCKTIRALMASL